jgi:hypothetical protein
MMPRGRASWWGGDGARPPRVIGLCVIRKAFSSEGIFENDLVKYLINFTNELAACFHEYVETAVELTIFRINNKHYFVLFLFT